MEAQVKQRITGAIVLVVLIVIFVPALLTGPRRPAPAATTAAALPGQAALQSYRSDLKASPTQLATPASETPQANADDAVAPVTAGDSLEQSPVPPEEAATRGPTTTSQTASSTAPAAASVSKPRSETSSPSTTSPAKMAATQTRTTPVAKPPQKAAQAPRQSAESKSANSATIASASTPSAPASSSASGAWAVQLGGFSSRVNAEKLVGDLKRQGFTAFVSDASSAGHPLFRVRAGPVKERSDAEALLKRLKAAGHSGSVSTNP